MLAPAVQHQAAVEMVTRTIQSGGLILVVEDTEKRSGNRSRMLDAGGQVDRRSFAWTMQDHDELIRQGQTLISIDNSLRQLFSSLGEAKATASAIEGRVKTLEDTANQRKGYEQAVTEVAGKQALRVSLMVAVTAVIINFGVQAVFPIISALVGKH